MDETNTLFSSQNIAKFTQRTYALFLLSICISTPRGANAAMAIIFRIES